MVPGTPLVQAGAMTENLQQEPATGPRVTSEEMRDLTRLRRSSTDRHVAGVAGGLGRHLDVDPVILRVAFVVFTFFGGAGLILYGAGWLLVPADDEPNAKIDLEPRTRSGALILVGVIAALATIGDMLGGTDFWVPFPLLAVALVVWFIVSRRERRQARKAAYPAYTGFPGQAPAPGWVGGPANPPAQGWVGEPVEDAGTAVTASYQGPITPPFQPVPYAPKQRDPRKRGPILFWYAVPLIALGLGTLGIVDASGVAVADSAYPALALGIIATLLVVGAFWGRAGGLIAIGLVAALVTAGATAASEFDGGQKKERPTTAAQVDDDYWLDSGEYTIDLSQLADPAALAGRTLDMGVGVGRLEVIIPSGVDLQIDGEIGGPGSIRFLDDGEKGGINIKDDTRVDTPGTTKTVELDLFVGIGEIVVVTSPTNGLNQ